MGTSPPRCPRWAGSQASPLSPVSMRSQEACQPGGPALAARPGSHWTENNFCHVGFSGSQAPGAGHTTAPQTLPGASRILQDLLMPRPSYPDSRQPHSSAAVLDAKARGADSQDTDTLRPRPRLRPGFGAAAVGLGVLSRLTASKPLPRPFPGHHLISGRDGGPPASGEAAPRAVPGAGLQLLWKAAGEPSRSLKILQTPGSALPSMPAVQFLGSTLHGPLCPAEEQDQVGCGPGAGISLRQFSRPWSGELPTGLPVKTQHSRSWLVRARSCEPQEPRLCPVSSAAGATGGGAGPEAGHAGSGHPAGGTWTQTRHSCLPAALEEASPARPPTQKLVSGLWWGRWALRLKRRQAALATQREKGQGWSRSRRATLMPFNLGKKQIARIVFLVTELWIQ